MGDRWTAPPIEVAQGGNHTPTPTLYTDHISKQPMKVYVVTAHDLYEQGVDVCCLFMHEADAAAYAADLEKEFDVVEVNHQTVHHGSLVAA